jgi:hypothetical protein
LEKVEDVLVGPERRVGEDSQQPKKTE